MVSGLLLLLAFPPFNLGLLVFVALVPWIFSLRNSNGKQGWQSGYLFGIVFGLGQLFWVAQLTARWVGSLAIGVIPWFVACSLYAIYFGWIGSLIAKCWQRQWPWAIPFAWAGIEVIRSFMPTFAFPWGLVATPLWPYFAIIQAAHFGTIFLISAWVLAVNVGIVEFMSGLPYVKVRPYVLATVGMIAASLLTLSINVPSDPFRITMGQPGVDMAFGKPEDQYRDLRTNVNAIVHQAKANGTRILVLPEGIAEGTEMPPKAPFDIPTDLPILFGGRRGESPTFQSAFAFEGGKWQFVDKTRLVVFGEYVPFREYISLITKTFKLEQGDLTAGRNGVGTVKLGGLTIGPVVCFEALFPDVTYTQTLKDARLLAVIGIDDWYMDGNAPDQIKAASIWRAIETGLPLVRSTTLGYTLTCDGHGRITAEAPMKVPFSLTRDIPVPRTSPAFFGSPTFPVLAAIFALGITFVNSKRQKGGKVGSNESPASKNG
jgi:apolipoprotein N-acyltransferase